METIAVKSLLARSKVRLGVTDGAGLAGLAKGVNCVQGYSAFTDGYSPSAFLPITIPVVSPGVILVLAPTDIVDLSGLPGKRRRNFLEVLPVVGISCLALAGVGRLPDFLVCFAERNSTFVFGSRFDDTLLASRLLGLLREKLQRRLSVQGALVNVHGLGVLITGASGTGKTTLALALTMRGHKWIADDVVEIHKNRDGRLSGRSHALVKNLLEIKEIGVLPVRSLLPAESIVDETSVDMVVELERSPEAKAKVYGARSVSTILGVRLPLLPIFCSKDRHGQLENSAKIICQAG